MAMREDFQYSDRSHGCTELKKLSLEAPSLHCYDIQHTLDWARMVLSNEPKDWLFSLLSFHVLLFSWEADEVVSQHMTVLSRATFIHPSGGCASSDRALQQIRRLAQGKAHFLRSVSIFKGMISPLDTFKCLPSPSYSTLAFRQTNAWGGSTRYVAQLSTRRFQACLDEANNGCWTCTTATAKLFAIWCCTGHVVNITSAVPASTAPRLRTSSSPRQN